MMAQTEDFTGATITRIENSVDKDLRGNVSLTGTDPTLTIGASADQSIGILQIIGDADSDGSATTADTFQVTLTPTADPTDAVWAITSTQSAGYSFDKAVDIIGDFTANKVTSDGAVLIATNDAGAIGASGTAFSDLFLADAGVINWNAGGASITHTTSTNQLIVSGGTGGLRLDNTVGIGIAPEVNSVVRTTGHSITGSGNTYDHRLGATLVINHATAFGAGLHVSPTFDISDVAGTHATMASAWIVAPSVMGDDGTHIISNLASLYVENAPTDGTSNYSIFVDAGDVRFDGGFVMGGGTTAQAQQAHIIDADGSLADITTKFNTLLADLEGYGLLASA